MSDKHRFRVICCGRRWGKTTEAIEEMKGYALYKGARVCYIAPTYQQARDIAWAALKKELLPIILKENESRLELTLRSLDPKKNATISLRGWESIDTLRGQAYDLVIVDEVAMMRNFWMNWQEVIRPTLTDTKGEAMFISTPKGFNHFYELFNKESEDPDFKSFHFSSFDNPHLDKSELEAARLQMTEDQFSQEYMADFRKTQGLVYKEFDRKIHLYKPKEVAIRPVERIAGVDFGFTHPCAVISVIRDYDSHFWVEAEYYKQGQSEEQIAEYVSAQSFNKVYPDPESPSAISCLQKKRVNVREVVKNKDSVKNGINKVRELLKAGRLHISEECHNLINEFETYSYADKKDNQYENENPLKEHDDALDALRYVLMMAENDRGGVAHVFIPNTRGYDPIPRPASTVNVLEKSLFLPGSVRRMQ